MSLKLFKKSITITLLGVLFHFLLGASALADEKSLQAEINQIELAFQQLSKQIYQHNADELKHNDLIASSINQILADISQVTNTRQSIQTIQLIYASLDLIQDNLDNLGVLQIIKFLLAHSVHELALILFEGIEQEGDKFLIASVRFMLADYHSDRSNWGQVHALLPSTFSELSAEQSAQALLLDGVALQFLKQHRKALEVYAKIPRDSQYRIYAQLNSSIAEIRQGWITNARQQIEGLISTRSGQGENELTNRLYLILGYALLQKEYYRDARDAFRRISLDSQYANRALLGIGLTATSQGDYVGGLNVLSILQNKKSSDLSRDESFLLLPYVYEKLKQDITATASYTTAIDYYQQRLASLDQLLLQHFDVADIQYLENTGSLVVNENDFDYKNQFPTALMQNYQQLAELAVTTKDNALQKAIEVLLAHHDQVLQKVIKALINQRKTYLISYLNQSQYGLARLYDNNPEEVN